MAGATKNEVVAGVVTATAGGVEVGVAVGADGGVVVIAMAVLTVGVVVVGAVVARKSLIGSHKVAKGDKNVPTCNVTSWLSKDCMVPWGLQILKRKQKAMFKENQNVTITIFDLHTQRPLYSLSPLPNHYPPLSFY